MLAPIGLIGLVAATRTAPTRSASLRAGVLFGVGFMGTTLSWLVTSFGAGPWVALAVVQAAWFGLVGYGWSVVRDLPLWPLWFASLWTAVEGLRAAWPLGGMPWGRLGFTAPDAPWAMVLSWLGVAGTGFVVVLASCATVGLVEAAARRVGRSGLMHAALLVLLAAGTLGADLSSPVANTPPPRTLGGDGLNGAPRARSSGVGDAGLQAPSAEENAREAVVGIVQGGVPGSGTQVGENHRQVTRNHRQETGRLADRVADDGSSLSFVLWPENSTAVDPSTDPVALAEVRASVRRSGVPVVAGSPAVEPGTELLRNQVVVWAEGGPGQRYVKRHLVPFGEFVPFRSLAAAISSRVAAISRDMVPGPKPDQPIEAAGTPIAPAICFDVAYDDVIRPQVVNGAELVTISTSNAMFLGTAQPEQQWAISRARAIETRRAVVVASINGVSGAIGPDGSVIVRLPDRESASAAVPVPLIDSITPATWLGAWPQRVSLFLGVLGPFLAVVLRLVRRRGARGRLASEPRRDGSGSASPAGEDAAPQDAA